MVRFVSALSRISSAWLAPRRGGPDANPSVRPRALTPDARREDSPMVGREEELAAVDEALREAAASRQARLVTIIGDAGMGKSRLAREVIARAGDSPAVAGDVERFVRWLKGEPETGERAHG